MAECVAEYKELTTFVSNHSHVKSCKTLQEFAKQTLGTESVAQLFPLVSQLFVHALVLPMSTVDCERCFKSE